jgi:hypothetical protein
MKEEEDEEDPSLAGVTVEDEECQVRQQQVCIGVKRDLIHSQKRPNT